MILVIKFLFILKNIFFVIGRNDIEDIFKKNISIRIVSFLHLNLFYSKLAGELL